MLVCGANRTTLLNLWTKWEAIWGLQAKCKVLYLRTITCISKTTISLLILWWCRAVSQWVTNSLACNSLLWAIPTSSSSNMASQARWEAKAIKSEVALTNREVEIMEVAEVAKEWDLKAKTTKIETLIFRANQATGRFNFRKVNS